jgi:hypothetical protein
MWIQRGIGRTLLLAVSFLVPVSSNAAELHRYLPDDTELVVAINFKQILGTKLAKDNAVEHIKGLIASSEEATAVLKDLGLDPLQHVHRVLVASPGSKEVDRGLIIIQGEFDPAKFRTKGADLLKNQPDFIKSQEIADGLGGKHLIYELRPTGQEFPWFVCIPARDAILLSPGKDYIVDALRKNPIKNPLALKDRPFQDLLQKVDDKQSLYLAGTATALDRMGLPAGFTQDFLKQMDGIAGGIKLDDDLYVELVMGAKTLADARSMQKSINDLHTQGLLILGLLAGQDENLSSLLDVAKTLRVLQKEKAVTLKARVDAELLEILLSAGQ